MHMQLKELSQVSTCAFLGFFVCSIIFPSEMGAYFSCCIRERRLAYLAGEIIVQHCIILTIFYILTMNA